MFWLWEYNWTQKTKEQIHNNYVHCYNIVPVISIDFFTAQVFTEGLPKQQHNMTFCIQHNELPYFHLIRFFYKGIYSHHHYLHRNFQVSKHLQQNFQIRTSEDTVQWWSKEVADERQQNLHNKVMEMDILLSFQEENQTFKTILQYFHSCCKEL